MNSKYAWSEAHLLGHAPVFHYYEISSGKIAFTVKYNESAWMAAGYKFVDAQSAKAFVESLHK